MDTIKSGQLLADDTLRYYRVDTVLGEGVTSIVYRATEESSGDSVALKVLRDGLGEIITDNFWQEATVLAEIAHAEYALGDGIQGVPHLRGQRTKGESPHFLVLEVIEGMPLDELIAEGQYLDEGTTLFIADRVLRVLDLLHREVRRTYTDFQLQNIWLQRTEAALPQGVRVMDWNHVSRAEHDKELPADFGANDLARLAAYLYRICTGKGAYETGEEASLLEQRAGNRWATLSLGTRKIIERALLPNPSQRFPDARGFREAIQRQRELWNSDWVELMLQVDATLNDLSTENGGGTIPNEVRQRVAVEIDILERLGANADKVNAARQKLGLLDTEPLPEWVQGKRYYDAGQFKGAASMWRQEAEKHNLLTMWRWVAVAETAAELGRERFEEVQGTIELAVTALEDHQSQHALEYLTRPLLASAQISDFPLSALYNEALAWNRLEDARLLDTGLNTPEIWEKIIAAYEEAQHYLATLAYASFVLRDPHWPDVNKLLQHARSAYAESHIESRHADEIRMLFETDFEQALVVLTHRLRYTPKNFVLAPLILEWSDKFLRSVPPHPERACVLLRLMMEYSCAPSYKSKILAQWREARSLLDKQRKYDIQIMQMRRRLGQHRRALTQQRNKRKRTIKRSRLHISIAESEISALTEELSELRVAHDSKLEELSARYRDELKALELQHEEKLDRTRDSIALRYKREAVEIESHYIRKQQELRDKFEDEKRERDEVLRRERESLQREQDADLNRRRHRNDLDRIDNIVNDGGPWDELLTIMSNYSSTHWIGETKRKFYFSCIYPIFERAVERCNVERARMLQRILDSIDPAEHPVESRNQMIQRMLNQLEEEEIKRVRIITNIERNWKYRILELEATPESLIQAAKHLLKEAELVSPTFQDWLAEQIVRAESLKITSNTASSDHRNGM